MTAGRDALRTVLAEALARTVGEFHNDPTWTGREIRSGLDEASIFAAQARWEQVGCERQAQIAAMEWALGQPEAWSLVERFAAEQVAAALNQAAGGIHPMPAGVAVLLRARAAAVLAAPDNGDDRR